MEMHVYSLDNFKINYRLLCTTLLLLFTYTNYLMHLIYPFVKQTYFHRISL